MSTAETILQIFILLFIIVRTCIVLKKLWAFILYCTVNFIFPYLVYSSPCILFDHCIIFDHFNFDFWHCIHVFDYLLQSELIFVHTNFSLIAFRVEFILGCDKPSFVMLLSQMVELLLWKYHKIASQKNYIDRNIDRAHTLRNEPTKMSQVTRLSVTR